MKSLAKKQSASVTVQMHRETEGCEIPCEVHTPQVTSMTSKVTIKPAFHPKLYLKPNHKLELIYLPI